MMQHRLHRLQRKRRGANKTNYKKRLELLKSRKTRFVVRKTNTKIIAQLVKYEPDGDRVLTSVYSTELKDLGWKGSVKNTPAAYLTGMLMAEKAKEEGVKKAVLDIGLNTPVRGARVFAVAKGAIDAGLEVPVSEDICPAEDRIRGEHLKGDVKKQFESVKNKIGAKE